MRSLAATLPLVCLLFAGAVPEEAPAAPEAEAAPTEDAPADAKEAPPAAQERLYAVITDDDLPIYRTVVTGVGVESLAAVDEHSLGGDPELGPAVMKKVLSKNPAAIVAVGPKAANAVIAAGSDVPVVYCMVPRLQSYRLDTEHSVGVRLERSYRVQLGALRELLPDARRVAVLYDPAKSGPSIKAARRAAADAGVELVAVAIDKPAASDAALATLVGKADALWMVADPTVLNLQTFDAMLRFAEAQKLPFFALNTRFVERGALLAFSLDYTRLGRQVGRIANQLAFEGRVAADIGQVAPEGLDIALNLTTAAQVGDPAQLYAGVLEYAAAHEHGVRVFK